MFVERVTVMYSVQDFLVFFSDSQLVAVKHFILRAELLESQLFLRRQPISTHGHYNKVKNKLVCFFFPSNYTDKTNLQRNC